MIITVDGNNYFEDDSVGHWYFIMFADVVRLIEINAIVTKINDKETEQEKASTIPIINQHRGIFYPSYPSLSICIS